MESDRELLEATRQDAAAIKVSLEKHLSFCREHELGIERRLACLEDRQDKHTTTLYGNGATGLTAKVGWLWWCVISVGSVALVAAGAWITEIVKSE